jgi:hypothetical protein
MLHIRHLLLPLASFVVACSGASSSGLTGSTGSALTGPIDVRLVEDVDGDVDVATPAATQVVVTITKVEAKLDEDDAWTTLALGPTTVDLLSLPATGFASLGVARLPASGVERLRLTVSAIGPDYVVTADGVHHALVVPSDAIAVVGDLDAEACAAGHVTLAFAARSSIAVHPLGDGTTEWVLRPVIRVKETVTDAAACPEGDDGEKDGDHGHGAGSAEH